MSTKKEKTKKHINLTCISKEDCTYGIYIINIRIYIYKKKDFASILVGWAWVEKLPHI
jgi:hypothetical protein